MGTMRRQQPWSNDGQATAWERVKVAVRRDWEQTKHDLHLKGGHELNQQVIDTVRQAAGKLPIPGMDQANPRRGPDAWRDVGPQPDHGASARDQYAAQREAWTHELDETPTGERESPLAKGVSDRGHRA